MMHIAALLLAILFYIIFLVLCEGSVLSIVISILEMLSSDDPFDKVFRFIQAIGGVATIIVMHYLLIRILG